MQLTDEDIEMMKATQDEIKQKRMYPLTYVYYEGGGSDPITNEPIDPIEVSRVIDTVVTEIFGLASRDKYIEGAVVYQIGDLQLGVKIELIADIIDKVTFVVMDKVKYEIISYDRKGIGKRNRYEILARRVT